ALHYGLIDRKKMIDFIKEKPAFLELILTGRYAPSEIIREADLVSEMKKVKHPFDQGTKARKGIEY
ncbi:MAG: cob(I)yrinic acid a,c-diamide adenosyltransferase, partial [Candidatus Asgardarchaeia archaeon]